MINIEFENSTELMLKVDAIQNIDFRRAFLKVGNDIERQAKINCTGRFSAPTGALKRSIRTELIPNGVEVGTNLEYAVYVEHGTGLYAFDGVGRAATPGHPIPWTYRGSDGHYYTTSGMRAKPFLIPAFNSKKHNITQYIKEEYDDRF